MTMNLLPRFETTIFFPNPNPVTQRRGIFLLPLRVRSHLRRQTCPKKRMKLTQQQETLRIPIPGRDRVIDFGKYKGRMLGTLPSKYLKWVSKNLRAREMEEWAKLADQVLEDPVYKDRMEWEFAQNLLSGNGRNALSSCESISAVDELMEISERFGWDNEDKKGWANIKFELLGTSKGGRIPRVEKSREEGKENKQVLWGVGEGRKERRERQRKKIRGSFESQIILMEQNENDGNGNPFPGRQALLRKVLNRRRLLP